MENKQVPHKSKGSRVCEYTAGKLDWLSVHLLFRKLFEKDRTCLVNNVRAELDVHEEEKAREA